MGRTGAVTTFPGVVTLADDNVDVTVGVGEEEIRLVAGDVEIGLWGASECSIKDAGNGVFLIEAENDALPFSPVDPEGFARVLTNRAPQDVPGSQRPSHPTNDSSGETIEIEVGPPPRLMTTLGFYLLAGGTAALGLWALISLF